MKHYLEDTGKEVGVLGKEHDWLRGGNTKESRDIGQVHIITCLSLESYPLAYLLPRIWTAQVPLLNTLDSPPHWGS